MTEVVEVPGPWRHRTLTARGSRFHVAEAGDGPLVLFVHGFPEFWWAWRHQLPAFAGSGYRAVALDLRGVGGSDHTPRGYDLPSLADDVAGVIGALGEARAVVVGHSWGGLVGWTLAALRPDLVDRFVAVSAAHPRALRRRALTSLQASRFGWALRMQLPWLPERHLVADDAAFVEQLLRRWSVDDWPDTQTAARYRAAMQLGNTAYCTAEYHRWAVRSQVRPDGIGYLRRMRASIGCPVLQVHGERDPLLLTRTAEAATPYLTGPRRFLQIPGVGHFPHEQAPEAFSESVLGWLHDVEPEL